MLTLISLVWFYLKKYYQLEKKGYRSNYTHNSLWKDWEWENWDREPCLYGSLRLHCSNCCDNIYKYFNDCEDLENETVYLLPKPCEVCGRDRKICLSEIQLVNFFKSGFC